MRRVIYTHIIAPSWPSAGTMQLKRDAFLHRGAMTEGSQGFQALESKQREAVAERRLRGQWRVPATLRRLTTR